MNITGIIVEYNPFHKGHAYHIEQAREQTNASVLIAIMSGYFVQRGEPAIIDKWERAKTAILQGVDLVIELPPIACVQSANHFAENAISILKELGITHLVFGSETNNLMYLQKHLDTPLDVSFIKHNLKQGKSYAASLTNEKIKPNDILGLNYLRFIEKTSIKPILIQRTNDYHDLTIQPISSASAIRHQLKETGKTDASCMNEQLNHAELVFIDDYYPIIRHLLLTMPVTYLKRIFLMSEGIENHLKKIAQQYSNYGDFIYHATSKRYTKSRIQRTLIHLLAFTLYDDIKPSKYIRVLALNSTGKDYLKKLQNPFVITRFKDLPSDERHMYLKYLQSYTSALSDQKQKELFKQEIGGSHFIKTKEDI